MARASSIAELQELHRLVTQSFKVRLEEDLKDNIPTDAATLGAAIKLLKDNEVTSDPADKDDLNEMRAKLTDTYQAGNSDIQIHQQCANSK